MDQPEEAHEPVVLSETVMTGLARHNRIRNNLDIATGLLWSVGLFCAIVATMAEGVFRDHTVAVIFGSPAVVLLPAASVSTFIVKRFLSTSFARLVRMGKTERILDLIAEDHPELVALQEALELVNEEKEEASSRRGFWIGFWQSAFFLVLGILISYTLARLGWLR